MVALQSWFPSSYGATGGVGDTQVLHVYNRTTAKAEEFAAEHSCTVWNTVGELRDACSIICMMLADDRACTSVLDQLCSSSAATTPSSSSSSKPLHGKVVVNHSTVTPDFTRAAAQQVASAGGTYLNVPVFGR
jgi:3-hydroxyisobutyrate dehydrogenase-like beta-hydroxyacid dehydrogenase